MRVELDAMDTYSVSRILNRGGREFPKDLRENVYADEVGEAAYYAGMYQSYDEAGWVDKR